MSNRPAWCYTACLRYFEVIQKDPRYADVPADQLPTCESLELTIGRTLPYWNENVVPQLKDGKKLIIAAHGNSLRGIVKHLDGLSNEQIMEIDLPTGIPFMCVPSVAGLDTPLLTRTPPTLAWYS